MHNPPRILIADDNEDNRDILATQLATQDYELLQAADGEEAVAVARSQLPDLILLDIMMPKLDGLEVCRRLKGDASLPFMPIILVTVKSLSTRWPWSLASILFYESRSFMIRCLRRPLSSPRGAGRWSNGWRSSCPRSSALAA